MKIEMSAAEIKSATKLTNQKMADAIGKSVRAVEQYLAAEKSNSKRDMQDSDKMLLVLRHKIKELGLDPDRLINEFLDETKKNI